MTYFAITLHYRRVIQSDLSIGLLNHHYASCKPKWSGNVEVDAIYLFTVSMALTATETGMLANSECSAWYNDVLLVAVHVNDRRLHQMLAM